MSKLPIANTLRTLRQNAGYTQAYVSQKLNIQRQTYCNYENASRTPPPEILVALSELYHVSTDYLICGKEPASCKSSHAISAISPQEQLLLSEFSTLSESKRKEVLAFVRFKKKYNSDI